MQNVAMDERKRLVVVGMGFGGIRAALGLADSGLEVTLVDRNNYHLFQPLLYQVATAGLEEESIAYPIRALIRNRRNLSFRMAEVVGLDLTERVVLTDKGPLEYDYLVLAGGSATNYFGNKGVENHSFDLKRLADAESLRNTILGIFEQAVLEQDPILRQQMLTFVVVGGGPTGVEFAGALSELIRYVFRKDYPTLNLDESRVMLLEAAPSILGAMPERLRRYAEKQLQSMGVEVRCNTMVADAGPGTVTLAGGEVIGARTLFWSAGVKAAPLAEMLSVEKGPGGRVVVTPHLNLPEDDRVYVIGDMACYTEEGKVLPMMAPVAMQQGSYVASALRERASGVKQPDPFRYQDKGSMATIGRNSAVVSAFGINLSGYFAWIAWLFLHLYYLIGFRNRIVVLLNWGWYFWFHERQVRLITAQKKTVEGEE